MEVNNGVGGLPICTVPFTRSIQLFRVMVLRVGGGWGVACGCWLPGCQHSRLVNRSIQFSRDPKPPQAKPLVLTHTIYDQPHVDLGSDPYFCPHVGAWR